MRRMVNRSANRGAVSHGNVNEWVEDCWHESYAGAPSDTNVWMTGDCRFCALRGSSWVVDPVILRSAQRQMMVIEYRSTYLGFRISRTLPCKAPVLCTTSR